MFVTRGVIGETGAEKRKHFTWLGMSAGIGFRVQHLVVDDDVKDSS